MLEVTVYRLNPLRHLDHDIVNTNTASLGNLTIVLFFKLTNLKVFIVKVLVNARPSCKKNAGEQ